MIRGDEDVPEARSTFSPPPVLTTTAPPRAAPPDAAQATLADVDIRAELETRPVRAPNYEGEREAFALLGAEMARQPRNMLQKLVEIAVELCRADTAGISLLDDEVFRWEAVAGVLAAARGSVMPRTESPCGVCVDRDATQLMYLADRCFTALWAEPRFVETLLIPLHDHGTPVGTVWIVSHTFERKFDREDERIVRELTEFASAGWQLWKACAAAEDTNRRKDDFLATLGHELRNPFAAITTAASLLQLRLANDEGARRAIDVIARQARHVSRLADDLLDTARIGTGKLQLDKRLVDLRSIVAETIQTKRDQIERRRQELSVDLTGAPILLEADPVRLAQVVANLLDNAAKYTPEGGRIVVAVDSKAGEASIEVRDTGVGLPNDQLQRIFDPFVQLRNSQDSSVGLGLGLALARRLTELHGGTLRATSSGPGQGSCFAVHLPASDPAAAQAYGSTT